MPSTFVLLGAGFSRAVNDSMPLLDDLARRVVPRLPVDADVLTPFADNLEQWMSYLSQDQPWLDDSANLRNQALFREAALAVAYVIGSAEREVIAQSPPMWLLRLVSQWCRDGTSVATFNYDTLVELATSHMGLAHTYADLYRMALTSRTPPGTNYMFATEAPASTTYSLFKLHGSTNWMYGGIHAPPSDPVVLSDHQHRRWMPPTGNVSSRTGRDRSVLDDLEPMIVPPTGTKGPYYGNRSLRAQWHQAFLELQASEHLLVVGYSFPASDLVTRHFVASSGFTGTVTVVDRSPAAVSELQRLLPEANGFSTFHGATALPDFVDATCGDLIRWRATRTDDGCRSLLAVNDNVEVLPTTEFIRDGGVSYDSPAMQALEAEVERRWPGLAQSRPEKHRMASSGDGEQWMVAYAPRDADCGTEPPSPSERGLRP